MFDGLNPGQREAVMTLDGPVLVLAGAGTGKTRVITCRIANLIRHGTSPERILAVTFTNKAAREMKDRALALLGKRFETQPLISTFHSLCVNVLRLEIDRLGYRKTFTIYDRSEQESVARSALRELRLPAETLAPRDLLFFVGKWKTAGVEPREARLMAGTEIERHSADAYKLYQSALKNAHALDFDDLLMVTDQLFRDHPDVAERQRQRWDRILVDEYQDTSGNQYRIIKQLASGHKQLCVVGDDDQSIYGWRGAEIRNILEFQKDFPKARVIRLEENYRCCPNILKLANDLIRWNPKRHEKVLRPFRPTAGIPRFVKYEDETAEARGIALDIHRTSIADKVPWSDFAILFRTNEQARPFETELRALNIPYILVGGLSFYDRREIKDLVSYLKVCANPSDEPSLERILNVPPRGVGDAVREKLLARAIENRATVWDILPAMLGENALPGAALAGLRNLVAIVGSFRGRLAARPNLVDWTRELVDALGYRVELKRQYPQEADFESRWAAVGEFLNGLARYEQRADQPSLAGFLQEITLDSKDDELEDRQRNRMVLMTLHSAKGLEFPHVYLVGLEDGILPHERSKNPSGIAEERRLLYVGVTRARDRLTMSRAEFRTKFGKKLASKPSRFLPELAGQEPLDSDALAELDRSARQADSTRRPTKAAANRGFTRGKHYRAK